MTYFIYANNVNTTLAGAISSSATSLTLSSAANLPPSIPAGAVFVITLNDRATGQNYEIIYATSISGATLSGLLRGQDGTAAQSWLTNDFAYSAPTAGEMNGFGQLGADNTWAGNNTFSDPVVVAPAVVGGDAAQYQQVVKTIAVTVLTGGSGTYTTPLGAKALRVRRVGGGGGGAGSGTGATNGSAGGATTFGSLPSVGGGSGGIVGSNGGIGGLSAGNDFNISGQQGSAGVPSNAANFAGGNGGVSPFGGAGVGQIGGNGTAAQLNSGSGGGGGSAVSGTVGSSGGGGAGGYAENWIVNPAASYSYSVGAGGPNGGGAAFGGGYGANGQIIVEALI